MRDDFPVAVAVAAAAAAAEVEGDADELLLDEVVDDELGGDFAEQPWPILRRLG
jgi:hypothetical protein